MGFEAYLAEIESAQRFERESASMIQKIEKMQRVIAAADNLRAHAYHEKISNEHPEHPANVYDAARKEL